MDLANQDRAQQGLAPLKWDPALAQAAAAHAQIMAGQPELAHQYPGEPDLAARCGAAGAHFRIIEENVALAPTPQALEQEWMHSPPHRANIMNGSMNTIGVGLVKRGANYYAVEDFASGSDEGLALEIFLIAGLFSDQDKFGVGCSCSWDNLSCVLIEVATFACGKRRAKSGKRVVRGNEGLGGGLLLLTFDHFSDSAL